VETAGWEDQGVVCGKPAPPRLQPSYVSVKDRCQQKLEFSAIASLAVMGEKLGMDPWIGQPACCRLCQEPFFSGAVNLFKSVDNCMKGCYMWTV
jgi:hypothetical protein